MYDDIYDENDIVFWWVEVWLSQFGGVQPNIGARYQVKWQDAVDDGDDGGDDDDEDDEDDDDDDDDDDDNNDNFVNFACAS